MVGYAALNLPYELRVGEKTGRVGSVQERSHGIHAVGMVGYAALNPPYMRYRVTRRRRKFGATRFEAPTGVSIRMRR